MDEKLLRGKKDFYEQREKEREKRVSISTMTPIKTLATLATCHSSGSAGHVPILIYKATLLVECHHYSQFNFFNLQIL